MSVISQPIPTIAKSRYRSRLGIIIAKELGDIVLRRPGLGVFLRAAFLVVPMTLVCARMISGVHGQDPLPSRPMFEDNTMRMQFPNELWIVSMILPMMVGLFIGQTEDRGTLEPLLVTAARRWEIIAGKQLAFGLAWFGFVLIQVAMLAVLPHISAVVSWCPFLNYFHPTMAFFVKLALVSTFGGWSGYAAFSLLSMSLRATGILLVIIVSCIFSLAGQYCSTLWPLLGFTPLINMANGLSAVFADLPYDPRIQDPAPHFGAAWDHPHFWLVAVVGAAVTTSVLAALMVRGLRSGELMTNTAK